MGYRGRGRALTSNIIVAEVGILGSERSPKMPAHSTTERMEVRHDVFAVVLAGSECRRAPE